MNDEQAKALDLATQQTIQELTKPLSEEHLSDYHFYSAQGAVMSFMRYAGQQIRTLPTAVISEEEKARIRKVVREEVEETFLAMDEDDLVEVADGIVDSIYTLLSAAVSYGIPIAPLMREVCNNNHLKTLSPKRLSPEGKLLKPEGHPKPRIAELLSLIAQVTKSGEDLDDAAIEWTASPDAKEFIVNQEYYKIDNSGQLVQHVTVSQPTWATPEAVAEMTTHEFRAELLVRGWINAASYTDVQVEQMRNENHE